MLANEKECSISAFASVLLASPLAALQTPLPAHIVVAEEMAVATAETRAPLIDPALAQISWSLNGTVATTLQETQSGQGVQGSVESQAQEETAGDPPPEEGNQIIVTGGYGPPEEDPLMRVNERAFDITEGVDQAVVGPIAYAYEEALPSPFREASRNFLRNLREPTNFINFVLQGKFGKAFETLGRFAINSTVGFGGLVDMAGKPGIGLPYRRTGFSDTLGFYGVGDGPFLVLPLVGSTTVRDFFGAGLDQALFPMIVGKPLNTPEYGVPAYVLNSLNFRLEFDEQLTDIRDSDDPYVELREQYLAKRRYEIELLKSGDDMAGIPGAYLEFKRTQEQAGPSTKEQVPEATAPISEATQTPTITVDSDVIEAAHVDITEEGGQIATRECTVAAPCMLERPQFAAAMVYPVISNGYPPNPAWMARMR